MSLVCLDLHISARMQVDRVFGSCVHVLVCILRSVEQSVCNCYSALASLGSHCLHFSFGAVSRLPLAPSCGSWCWATCCSWNSGSTRICAAYSLCFLRCGPRHWSFNTCLLATHRDGVAASLRKTLVVHLIAQSIRFFSLSFSFFLCSLLLLFFSFSSPSTSNFTFSFRFGQTLML